MLYNKTGRLVDRYPEKQTVGVRLSQLPREYPVLKVSPQLIGGYRSQSYELLIGRNKHADWIGLWFNKKKNKIVDGKFKMRPYWCTTKLKAYECMRFQDFEDLEYVVTTEILFVKLPHRQGLVEQESWWLSLPDVRDNPQDAWAEIRRMSNVWDDGGAPEIEDILPHSDE